jgi:hypothetical protein
MGEYKCRTREKESLDKKCFLFLNISEDIDGKKSSQTVTYTVVHWVLPFFFP